MKIGFNTNIEVFSDDSGKHKFFNRLLKEFRKRDIEISNNNPDILLCLPKYSFSIKSKVKILRLDGITFNTTKKIYKSRIKNLFKDIEQSDALIYQSQFCKDAHNKFLGVEDNKKYKIIFNGASPEEFLPRSPKNYFLANCKWRELKRLDYIIESFLLALEMGLNSDLIITGEPDFVIKNKRIKYIGYQNSEQIKILLSGAISTLHLSWIDCFPNSMVESIVADCPVIYTESGGQIELGRNSGIGIKDKNWNFKPYDSDIPPVINKEEIAMAMLKIKKEKMEIKEREDLYISNICDQYLKFFKELL